MIVHYKRDGRNVDLTISAFLRRIASRNGEMFGLICSSDEMIGRKECYYEEKTGNCITHDYTCFLKSLSLSE